MLCQMLKCDFAPQAIADDGIPVPAFQSNPWIDKVDVVDQESLEKKLIRKIVKVDVSPCRKPEKLSQTNRMASRKDLVSSTD